MKNGKTGWECQHVLGIGIQVDAWSVTWRRLKIGFLCDVCSPFCCLSLSVIAGVLAYSFMIRSLEQHLAEVRV